MLREIRKKLVILRNRSPFAQEVKDYLNDLEYREWMYMNMSLSGSRLTREEIDTVLRGGWVMDASVSDHLMLDRLSELRSYIYRLTDMGANLSMQILQDMQVIITGSSDRNEYRKGNPMLQEYGCSPMMASDIPRAMAEVLHYINSGPDGGTAAGTENPLEKAAAVHNRLLEIYPFKEGSEMVARAVMYYILAEAGYPLAALPLTKEEYDRQFIYYLKHRDSRGLAQMLGKAVAGRLDLMMQLTRYDA